MVRQPRAAWLHRVMEWGSGQPTPAVSRAEHRARLFLLAWGARVLSHHPCCRCAAVRESLGSLVACLGEALGRTPSEAVIFRDYGRAVLAIDEVVCEVCESKE